jgi:Flp pilus assembly protein TadD
VGRRQSLGKTQEAKADLHEALALDPTYALAHTNLAALLRAEGDERGASQHTESARAMGLRQDQIEGVLSRLGALLARFEGQSTSI